ncbi:MAG: hypothetical protein U0X73_08630 [Thermoanaerobaculia bacterium]
MTPDASSGALHDPSPDRVASSPPIRRIGQRLLVAFLVAFAWGLAASAVLDSFENHSSLGDHWPYSRFEPTIHFKTERPFIYRVLTPGLVWALSSALPDRAAELLAGRAPELRERYHLRRATSTEYVVAHVLLFLALVGTLAYWRASLLRHGGTGPLFASFAPPLALLFYPVTFTQGGFLYDLPELFFASAALHYFLGRRWVAFCSAFALAVLNKESSILLLVWFLAAFWIDRDRGGLLRRGGAALVAGGLPFVVVHRIFADRPGQEAYNSFSDNLEFFTSPARWLQLRDLYAPALPGPAGPHLLLLAAIAAVLASASGATERLLRLIFASTALVIFPLYVVYGWRGEIRVFAGAFPALILLACLVVRRLGSESAAAESVALS